MFVVLQFNDEEKLEKKIGSNSLVRYKNSPIAT